MLVKRIGGIIKCFVLVFFSTVLVNGFLHAQHNLSLTGFVSASSQVKDFEAEKAIDGRASSWKSEPADTAAWLMVKLPGATEIFSIHIKTDAQPISDFEIQTMLNGTWRNVKEVTENTLNEVELTL